MMIMILNSFQVDAKGKMVVKKEKFCTMKSSKEEPWNVFD